MKMNLLNDILKGLEALERRQLTKKPVSTATSPKSTGKKSFGKLITVSREPSRGPAGEPISTDPYAVDYPAQPYEYDPEQLVFLQVDRNSPDHSSKLKDLGIISKYDPTTAHKILTLA